MADFNWYINKQGIRGHKGDKGDQGFSPYFTEEVNTMNEYKLRVHNEFDSFVTDNLRGNKIQIVNPDGTYVKYDKETGNFYVDSADYATGEIYGQVRLATLADVDLFDTESVLTPDVLSDTLPRYLVNNDGNITIAQGSDSKTELKLGSELHDIRRIYRNDTERYLTKGDFYFRQNPLRKFTPNSDALGVGYYLNFNTSHFTSDPNDDYKMSINSGLISKINSSATQTEVNSLRNTVSNLSSDLDTERTTRLNADNAINTELAAERNERQVQDAALQNQLGTKLTVDNIKSGDNIELIKSGNNITINSTAKGGSDLEILEGENIKFTYSDVTIETIPEANTDITQKVMVDNWIVDSYSKLVNSPIVSCYVDNDIVYFNTKITNTNSGSRFGFALRTSNRAYKAETINPDNPSDVRETEFKGLIENGIDMENQYSIVKYYMNEPLSASDLRYIYARAVDIAFPNLSKITINSTGSSDLQLYEGENTYFTQHTKEIVIPALTDISKYIPVIPRNDVSTTRHINFVSNTNDSPNSSFIRIGGNESNEREIIIDGSVSGIAYAYTYVDGAREKQLSLIKGDERVIIQLDVEDKNKVIELRTNGYITIQSIMFSGRIKLAYEEEGTIVINSTGGGAIIDDETVSTDKVFSSSRTSELVGEVGNDLQDLAQRVNDIESLKVPNVVIIGEPMIQNGQVSDLDEQNHLQFPFVIERKGRPFICDFEFTTGANVTRQQNIIDSRCSVAVAIRNSRLVGALSSNGQTFNLGEKTITDTIRPYTTYYCRLEGWKDGTEYNYRLLLDTNPNIGGSSSFVRWSYLEEPIFPTTMTIGSEGNSFDGVIDLNKWSLKIDNDLVWLGMDNVGQAVSANVSLSNINEAGVKVINDLIDAKIGDIEALIDEIIGRPIAELGHRLDDINGEDIE